MSTITIDRTQFNWIDILALCVYFALVFAFGIWVLGFFKLLNNYINYK